MKTAKLSLFLLIAFITIQGLAENTKSSFSQYDIYIDSGKSKLAAWEMEIYYDPKECSIVGIEGGNTKAFPANRPPFYDPKGMKTGKIIIANFCADKKLLKSGNILAATLHLHIKGEKAPELIGKLIAACDENGKKINVKIKIEKKGEK
jgi:hypothetical protein